MTKTRAQQKHATMAAAMTAADIPSPATGRESVFVQDDQEVERNALRVFASYLPASLVLGYAAGEDPQPKRPCRPRHCCLQGQPAFRQRRRFLHNISDGIAPLW